MNHQPVVQLFYNPASGSFSPARMAALAAAFEAEGARVVRSESVREVPVLDAGATHVCIAGGDGTVRHVAMMLARAGATLPVAVWPAGTINLIAREGGPSRPLARFARDLVQASLPRDHFLVTLDETMFLACASVGPDSFSVASVSGALKRRIGRLAYGVAFLGVLWRWPRPALRIDADGRGLACEAVYVAKGRYFAGPWSFAPAARVSDGLLHVVALRRARRRDFLVFCLDMLLGRDPGARANAMALTCRALAINCDVPVPVQADGDVVATCPVRLAVHPAPLPFH